MKQIFSRTVSQESSWRICPLIFWESFNSAAMFTSTPYLHSMNSAMDRRDALRIWYIPFFQLIPWNAGVTSIDCWSMLNTSLLSGLSATVCPLEVETKSMAPEYSTTDISFEPSSLTEKDVPLTSINDDYRSILNFLRSSVLTTSNAALPFSDTVRSDSISAGQERVLPASSHTFVPSGRIISVLVSGA